MALRDLLPPWPRREGTAIAPDPGPPELAAALGDLDRLIVARPELSAAGQALARVLRAAFGNAPPALAPEPHAAPDLLVAAWRAGIPAFRAGDAPPRLEPGDLRARGLSVCAALADGNPQAARVREAIRAGSADLHAWALEALADRTEAVAGRAEALGLEPTLACAVLRLAVLPALAPEAARLAGLRPEGAWSRGDCPNCGAPPALAEGRGLEQRRSWRCGLCAGDWPGDRLRCPFCGEGDHRKLRSRFAEGEQDRYRLALCDSCGGRLKVVATLGPLSAPGLLVAELATAHLDLLD